LLFESEVAAPPALEATMPEDAPRPAQAAIRTALGAIFGRVTVAEGFPDQPVSVRHEDRTRAWCRARACTGWLSDDRRAAARRFGERDLGVRFQYRIERLFPLCWGLRCSSAGGSSMI